MPLAKRTASGKWACRVAVGYEYKDGKRHTIQKQITADSKRECERLAAELADNRLAMADKNITFTTAVSRYIAMKEHVLSPYTIRSYRSLSEHAYGSIDQLRINDIRTTDLQQWMNSFSLNHSPKSCRNAYGLVTATLETFRPGSRFRVTLPQPNPPQLYTPMDEDIKKLLAHVKGKELELAILLSAFGTLRRGEACALTYGDIHGNTVSVTKSMVRVGDEWIVKTPKTVQSIRQVSYPPEVIQKILDAQENPGDPDERIIKGDPDAISGRFRRAVRVCKLPHFRYHDLRAYAVSIRHAMGIPDQYIMMDGGYKTDTVMKQIYRRTMGDKRTVFTDKVNAHFAEMISET